MSSNWTSEIEGVHFKSNSVFSDNRGSFVKFLDLSDETASPETYQDFSISRNPFTGTLRGMHFQIAPFAEEKAVMCIRGSIFEVFVDLRSSSKTYGYWTSYEITEANARTVSIPQGVAHGFQTLEDNTWILYGISAPFSPDHAQRIHYKDAQLGIAWPNEVTHISKEDNQGMTWQEFEVAGLILENPRA
ncbi:MAG: dTDP-4-dehydrorhamnose 3,5-epimerase family protein [Candidatus Nanopelagicaceae bacterium]|nr:dTDP-4-dehydrorhamnose 3,5-epimerase family protein [Candidatus Nanopelagicaceae bacterium]